MTDHRAGSSGSSELELELDWIICLLMTVLLTLLRLDFVFDLFIAIYYAQFITSLLTFTRFTLPFLLLRNPAAR
jgi:hypothetical protein